MKKEVRKPELWARNIRKKSKNEGKSYFSTLPKSIKKAKGMGPGCGDLSLSL